MKISEVQLVGSRWRVIDLITNQEISDIMEADDIKGYYISADRDQFGQLFADGNHIARSRHNRLIKIQLCE